MSNHPNRGRVNIRPLDSAYHRCHYKVLADCLPKGWRPEALIDDGLMARCIHTNALAVWQGDRIVSVDTNKAEIALARMHNDQSR